jgi:hypothetical protein
MLLNELQKQQRRNAVQDDHIAAQATTIRNLEQQMSELKNLRQQMAVMSAVLGKLQTNGEPGAQR